jgi:hypothetical protein
MYAGVYALAVVSYELVCGRRPYDAFGWPLVPVGSGAASPAPIAAAHGLPKEVDTVLAGALQHDPSDRPDNAGTFAELLASAGDDRHLAASRRDWPVALVVAVAVLLFAVSAAVAWALG